jgi:hypothetical protein
VCGIPAANGYDWIPSQTQVERAEALVRELPDLSVDLKDLYGFAKSEILSSKFDGVPIADIALRIHLRPLLQ